MNPTANEITASLLIEIPKAFPGARVWRSNRVDAMVPGAGGKIRRVKAGIDGQGDVTGIFPISVVWLGQGEFIKGKIRTVGLRLEIEVKAGRDKQSEAQKNFERMITDAGGIYLLVHSVEQCIEGLRRWV